MSIYDDLIRQAVKRETELVERACEAALQGGRHGVLVTTSVDYDLRDPEHLNATRTFKAAPSPEVPYGAIYYRTEDSDA